MGRVAFAEAGNQGGEGLAGVIFTILNRLHGGRWGASVAAVVDAPGQFEPVMRVGGAWAKLPALTPTQTVQYKTIPASDPRGPGAGPDEWCALLPEPGHRCRAGRGGSGPGRPRQLRGPEAERDDPRPGLLSPHCPRTDCRRQAHAPGEPEPVRGRGQPAVDCSGSGGRGDASRAFFLRRAGSQRGDAVRPAGSAYGAAGAGSLSRRASRLASRGAGSSGTMIAAFSASTGAGLARWGFPERKRR